MKPATTLACFASVILASTTPLATSASAQSAPPGSYTYNLPLDLAIEAAQEAVKTCESNGYRVTATIVDMAGTPKVVLRGDRSTVHTAATRTRCAPEPVSRRSRTVFRAKLNDDAKGADACHTTIPDLTSAFPRAT
jgi:uncharacterized protein GlcG (DUF336 family)